MNLSVLIKEVSAFYKKEGRAHLPWRKTHDPYKILVSEIMLQQTQAQRVIPFYEKFIQEFPDAETLASASLSRVLTLWSGLGYNRRGNYLREAAKTIIKDFNGRFPKNVKVMQTLPGVGPYTAGAVAAFAFNSPEVFIETNIRTVFTHFCFKQSKKNPNKKISDTEILPLIAEALKKSHMQPRDFYAALMDYGAYLKSTGIKINSRSKHYTKQSKFEGSARQKSAARLRELLQSGASEAELEKALKP